MRNIGVQRGTNPAIPVSEQPAAHDALAYAVGIEFPEHSRRPAITDLKEVRRIASSLNLRPLRDRMRGESIFCVAFVLPNDRVVNVHLFPDGWCFTGAGPCRRYARNLWRYLGLEGYVIQPLRAADAASHGDGRDQ
jgi:hypothetical protein